MLIRVIVALVVIGLGLLAYQGVLAVQRRRASKSSQRATTSGRTELLVFTSPTCGPCKLQQLPIIDRLMPDWTSKIELRVIDVTEQPERAAEFGVWSLPTTIVIDAARRVVAINQGVANERRLRQQLEDSVRGAL